MLCIYICISTYTSPVQNNFVCKLLTTVVSYYLQPKIHSIQTPCFIDPLLSFLPERFYTLLSL